MNMTMRIPVVRLLEHKRRQQPAVTEALSVSAIAYCSKSTLAGRAGYTCSRPALHHADAAMLHLPLVGPGVNDPRRMVFPTSLLRPTGDGHIMY